MRKREFSYVGFVTLIDGSIKVHHTQWTLSDPRFMPEDYGNEDEAKIAMASAIFSMTCSDFGGKVPVDGNYRIQASGDILLDLSKGQESAQVRMAKASYEPARPEDEALFKPYFDPINVYVRVSYIPMPC